MKTNFLFGIAIAATILTSCAEDGTSDIVITDNSTITDNSVTNNTSGGSTTGETILLTGSQTEDLVLDAANQYILDGPVVMEDGTTITIPAGTTIKANTGTEVYLAIAQGAQIIAEGTASQPIIFTSNSSTPNAGDWGGLILLGKAPINSVDGVTTTTATSEIASLPYGGSDSADNSGSLSYVRVEYSGGKVDGQSENNGISFYGVGNGTTVEYVQVAEGLDDGFEFFGGTVNASYIAVLNSDDDSIDWTEGYSGVLTDVYVKQNIDGDKAFECDGFNTDIGNNSDFYSSPEVYNVTIQGLGSASGKEAVRLRAGTEVYFENVNIIGYAEGFDIDDAQTGVGATNGDLVIDTINFDDVTTQLKNDTGATFPATVLTNVTTETGDSATTGTDFETWGAGWTKQ